MIKLDTKNWKVETDCRTVGEFMTEASVFGLSVKVTINDVDEYFFEGCQKVKVVDNTPIDKVLFDRTDSTLHARASFRVITKPKPKTVMKSGWTNIFKLGEKRVLSGFYKSKEEAVSFIGLEKDIHIATVKVEWEEVQE